MKTFFFGLIDKIKQGCIKVDIETILTQKAWFVLNDNGSRDTVIFKRNGKIVVSVNGNAKEYIWDLPIPGYLIIKHSELEGTLLVPVFINKDILIFQKDGTEECMFLIDRNSKNIEKLMSLSAIYEYFKITMGYNYSHRISAREEKKEEIDVDEILKQLEESENDMVTASIIPTEEKTIEDYYNEAW